MSKSVFWRIKSPEALSAGGQELWRAATAVLRQMSEVGMRGSGSGSGSGSVPPGRRAEGNI